MPARPSKELVARLKAMKDTADKAVRVKKVSQVRLKLFVCVSVCDNVCIYICATMTVCDTECVCDRV